MGVVRRYADIVGRRSAGEDQALGVRLLSVSSIRKPPKQTKSEDEEGFEVSGVVVWCSTGL